MRQTVVVGGGIGGLTAALALARRGREVQVLERASRFAEIGAGLQLAPNATRLLASLGVLDSVLAAGVLPRALVAHDAVTGERLSHIAQDDLQRRYRSPYVVLHRAHLLQILLDACASAGVVLTPSRTVTAVEERADTATAVCADGSRYDARLVVAADGLHSTLRRAFSNDDPVRSGYVAYRGAVRREAAAHLEGLRDVVLWMGPGIHLVQYPLREQELYNQVAVFHSSGVAAGDPDAGGPQELDAAFEIACPQVRRAIPSLWRDQRWPMYDREPIDQWTSGRCALLGDAAHPMLQYLAQGACQAIEDGVVLAESVEEHTTGDADDPTQMRQALAQYQAARAPRTARVQRTARVWGDIFHVDGLTAALRNEALRQRDPDDERHYAWLYRDSR